MMKTRDRSNLVHKRLAKLILIAKCRQNLDCYRDRLRPMNTLPYDTHRALPNRLDQFKWSYRQSVLTHHIHLHDEHPRLQYTTLRQNHPFFHPITKYSKRQKSIPCTKFDFIHRSIYNSLALSAHIHAPQWARRFYSLPTLSAHIHALQWALGAFPMILSFEAYRF